MIDYFDEKPRLLPAPADDPMLPQESGDQPTLSTVLLWWNVPDPTVAAFQRARERIFVTAKNPRDVIQFAIMFVSHRGLPIRFLQREVGSTVGK
jgi:hypothetical protein